MVVGLALRQLLQVTTALAPELVQVLAPALGARRQAMALQSTI